MDMEWQFPIVMLAVAGAVLFLARSAWRTWSGAKGGCGGSCGCGKNSAAGQEHAARPTLIPLEQLTLLQRKTPEK
jgi:hypothetical protein